MAENHRIPAIVINSPIIRADSILNMQTRKEKKVYNVDAREKERDDR